MKIEDVIAAINRMEADGVIGRYAIGGAVGATFYLEPIDTEDVDVFVALQPAEGSLVVSLRPIYDYLVSQGAVMKDEYIVISGWPVQFLPAANPLLEEALRDSVERDVGGVSVRVFTAEHLAAIALQTGRAKDKLRLFHFVEAGVLDAARFEEIVMRHHLVGAWKRFERQYLRDKP